MPINDPSVQSTDEHGSIWELVDRMDANNVARYQHITAGHPDPETLNILSTQYLEMFQILAVACPASAAEALALIERTTATVAELMATQVPLTAAQTSTLATQISQAFVSIVQFLMAEIAKAEGRVVETTKH